MSNFITSFNKAHREAASAVAVEAGVPRDLAAEETGLRPTSDGFLGLLSAADGKTIIAVASARAWRGMRGEMDKASCFDDRVRSAVRNKFIRDHDPR